MSDNFTTDMYEMLKILSDEGVQFFIVGAHAVNAYTEARLTKDLDILINPSLDNAKKTYSALNKFGAPLGNTNIEDFTDQSNFFVIGVKPNRIDILTSIPGLSFEDAWKRKKALSYGDLTIFVPAIDDLIAAKTASGRPQDLLDVTKLKLVKK